jgi:hypothetical protein
MTTVRSKSYLGALMSPETNPINQTANTIVSTRYLIVLLGSLSVTSWWLRTMPVVYTRKSGVKLAFQHFFEPKMYDCKT